jgi:hypothetical protein
LRADSLALLLVAVVGEGGRSDAVAGEGGWSDLGDQLEAWAMSVDSGKGRELHRPPLAKDLAVSMSFLILQHVLIIR